MTQGSAGECLCDSKFLSPWAGLEFFFFYFPGSFAPLAAAWSPNPLLMLSEQEVRMRQVSKAVRPNLLRAVKWIT